MTTLTTSALSTEVLESALLTLDQISTLLTVFALNASRNPEQSPRVRMLLVLAGAKNTSCHCPQFVALDALGKKVHGVLGGDYCTHLLSLIESLLLSRSFEEVATKFVPFRCPREVISGQFF
jgi:hypothetical protein